MKGVSMEKKVKSNVTTVKQKGTIWGLHTEQMSVFLSPYLPDNVIFCGKRVFEAFKRISEKQDNPNGKE